MPNRILRRGALLALLGLHTASFAQVYPWMEWSSVDARTVAASGVGIGEILLSPSGLADTAGEYSLQFENVAFTPVWAQAGTVSHNLAGAWSFTIDLSGVADTSRLVVGIGNLGFGDASLPGYSMAAFATGGGAMSLTTFDLLGSQDFRWILPSNPTVWNDDLLLDPVTGAFNVLVQGTKDFNSDLLLMRLPAHVESIVVSSNGLMGGDSVNVVVAALPVPEPDSWALFAAGGLLVALRRRRA